MEPQDCELGMTMDTCQKVYSISLQLSTSNTDKHTGASDTVQQLDIVVCHSPWRLSIKRFAEQPIDAALGVYPHRTIFRIPLPTGKG
jgi:hypothetical protein